MSTWPGAAVPPAIVMVGAADAPPDAAPLAAGAVARRRPARPDDQGDGRDEGKGAERSRTHVTPRCGPRSGLARNLSLSRDRCLLSRRLRGGPAALAGRRRPAGRCRHPRPAPPPGRSMRWSLSAPRCARRSSGSGRRGRSSGRTRRGPRRRRRRRPRRAARAGRWAARAGPPRGAEQDRLERLAGPDDAGPVALGEEVVERVVLEVRGEQAREPLGRQVDLLEEQRLAAGEPEPLDVQRRRAGLEVRARSRRPRRRPPGAPRRAASRGRGRGSASPR